MMLEWGKYRRKWEREGSCGEEVGKNLLGEERWF
jgi:hypothetical protein